jgi:hypothetical protein
VISAVRTITPSSLGLRMTVSELSICATLHLLNKSHTPSALE